MSLGGKDLWAGPGSSIAARVTAGAIRPRGAVASPLAVTWALPSLLSIENTGVPDKADSPGITSRTGSSA